MPCDNMKLSPPHGAGAQTSAYLEHARRHVSIPPRPHLLNEFCVGLCDFALHPQRVVSVYFGLILVFEEVVRQGRGVAQALKETGLALTPRLESTEIQAAPVLKGQPEPTPAAGRTQHVL